MVIPAIETQAALYNNISGRSCIPETNLNYTRREFDKIEIADNLKGIPWHRSRDLIVWSVQKCCNPELRDTQSFSPGAFRLNPPVTNLTARTNVKSSTNTSLRQYIKGESLVLAAQLLGKAPDAMVELAEIL